MSQINKYGLVSSTENCFYIVDTDYKTLKLMQVLFMKQKFLFSVNLTNLSEAKADLINPSNCSNFGLTPALIRSVALDIDTTAHGADFVEGRPGPTNKILYKNFIDIFRLLKITEQFFKSNKQQWEKRYRDHVNGLDEFGQLTKLLLPDDPNIDLFVDVEKKKYESPIEANDRLRGEIVRAAYSIDFSQPGARESLCTYVQNIGIAGYHRESIVTVRKIFK